MSVWIDVNKELPEYDVRVMVALINDDKPRFATLTDVSERHGPRWTGGIKSEHITHWMPVPALPNERRPAPSTSTS